VKGESGLPRGEAVLVNLSDGQVATRFGPTEAAITRVAVHPSGETIATNVAKLGAFGATLGELILWDRSSSKIRVQPNDLDVGLVHGLEFSQDGQTLVLGYQDRRGSPFVRLLDAATGQIRSTIPVLPKVDPNMTNLVMSVALSPDDKTLVLGGERAGYVGLIDLASGAFRLAPERHRGVVRKAAFSPDGKWLATGGQDRLVRVWDVEALQKLAPVDPASLPAPSSAPASR
jgi:WD40 repeat protein